MTGEYQVNGPADRSSPACYWTAAAFRVAGRRPKGGSSDRGAAAIFVQLLPKFRRNAARFLQTIAIFYTFGTN